MHFDTHCRQCHNPLLHILLHLLMQELKIGAKEIKIGAVGSIHQGPTKQRIKITQFVREETKIF